MPQQPYDSRQGRRRRYVQAAPDESVFCSYLQNQCVGKTYLTTLDSVLPTPQHDAPNSGTTVFAPMNKHWFVEQLKRINISQRQLAKRLELDPAAVSYMFSGKRQMSMDEAKRIAGIFLLPVTEVMRQAGIEVLDDVRKVPIAGHINQRGVVSLLPRGTHDMITAPADVPAGGFAVQMRSVNSARDGWLYFVSGEQSSPTDCLDRFCIVALKDGALLLATVKRGYKRELYNLVLMADGEPSVLENKEITWGAKVLWILPT